VSGMLTKRPKDWKAFLSNVENKVQFIVLLFRKWKDAATNAHKIQSQPVIFIQDRNATIPSSIDGIPITSVEIPELKSEQEESDARIILYVHYAQLKGFSHVHVCANDSDIFFILLHYASTLDITY
jgi:hypothetical protein